LLRRVAREAGNQIVLARRSVSGAVEIDDMGPGRPGLREGFKRGARIGGIDGGVLESALRQAHAAAAHQVDGGVDQHDRNASRKRAPAPALRSGWNWAPSRLPCRTAAGMVRPWRAVAMLAGPSSQAKLCAK